MSLIPSSNYKKVIPYDFKLKVSEVLKVLNSFKELYIEKDEIPDISENFKLNLFNTFLEVILTMIISILDPIKIMLMTVVILLKF